MQIPNREQVRLRLNGLRKTYQPISQEDVAWTRNGFKKGQTKTKRPLRLSFEPEYTLLIPGFTV